MGRKAIVLQVRSCRFSVLERQVRELASRALREPQRSALISELLASLASLRPRRGDTYVPN
jgi:hypothetical protein